MFLNVTTGQWSGQVYLHTDEYLYCAVLYEFILGKQIAKNSRFIVFQLTAQITQT